MICGFNGCNFVTFGIVLPGDEFRQTKERISVSQGNPQIGSGTAADWQTGSDK